MFCRNEPKGLSSFNLSSLNHTKCCSISTVLNLLAKTIACSTSTFYSQGFMHRLNWNLYILQWQLSLPSTSFFMTNFFLFINRPLPLHNSTNDLHRLQPSILISSWMVIEIKSSLNCSRTLLHSSHLTPLFSGMTFNLKVILNRTP